MDQERKQAARMTGLSCHRFRSNEVRLRLGLIAHNLRKSALPKKIENWSRTSVQQRLGKDWRQAAETRPVLVQFCADEL